MAMPASAMTVKELIDLAEGQGCHVVVDPPVSWTVDGKHGYEERPRYLARKDDPRIRVAIPTNDDAPVDVFTVSSACYRLKIKSEWNVDEQWLARYTEDGSGD